MWRFWSGRLGSVEWWCHNSRAAILNVVLRTAAAEEEEDQGTDERSADNTTDLESACPPARTHDAPGDGTDVGLGRRGLGRRAGALP
jgi:hypothetical protein